MHFSQTTIFETFLHASGKRLKGKKVVKKVTKKGKNNNKNDSMAKIVTYKSLNYLS